MGNSTFLTNLLQKLNHMKQDNIDHRINRTTIGLSNYMQMRATGLCVCCRKTLVGGERKSYCYDCSKRQQLANYRSQCRALLKSCGTNAVEALLYIKSFASESHNTGSSLIKFFELIQTINNPPTIKLKQKCKIYRKIHHNSFKRAPPLALYKEVLKCRYEFHMTYHAIADTLGLKKFTPESWCRRAKHFGDVVNGIINYDNLHKSD